MPRSAAYGIIMACLIVLAGAPGVKALGLGLDQVYSGGVPSGQAPWITLDFSDAGLNRVLLTISASGLVSPEFASRIAFNYNPGKELSNLVFTLQGGIPFAGYSLDEDGIHAGPVHAFDIGIEFATANRGKRFGAGTVSSILITSAQAADNLNALDFGHGVPRNVGVYYAAAHVQGLAGSPGSAWIGMEPPPPIPNPEPGTMLLMGAGVIGAALARMRGAKPRQSGGRVRRSGTPR